MILGSVGAFLVVEARSFAEARGARIYATIDAIGGDRGSRDEGRLEARLDQLSDGSAQPDVVFSGTSGFHALAGREHDYLSHRFEGVPVRGYGGLVGHCLEAQFPLGLALAALTLANGAPVPAFDPAHEAVMDSKAARAAVTTIGHARGEGFALLSAETKGA